MANSLYPPINGGGRIIVTVDSGSVVTATNQRGTVKTAQQRNGVWIFNSCGIGTWTIHAEYDGMSTEAQVVFDLDNRNSTQRVELSYNQIPDFTYTGSYRIVNDSGQTITSTQGNWQIQFLTSGIFTPKKLRGAKNGIDVFLVGGGGGGTGGYDPYRGGYGGAGYNKTVTGVSVADNGVQYSIVIGSGGTGGNGSAKLGTAGGSTSAFGQSAGGGARGGHAYNYKDGNHGAGGSKTYAFGSAAMGSNFYSVLGGGSGANTGNSGTATYQRGYNGGSGIVIIRNKR